MPHQQRIAVRRVVQKLQNAGASATAAATDIVDVNRLFQHDRHLVGDDAGNRVGRTAGQKRDDDAHRALGYPRGLRSRARGGQDRHAGCRDLCGPPSHFAAIASKGEPSKNVWRTKFGTLLPGMGLANKKP